MTSRRTRYALINKEMRGKLGLTRPRLERCVKCKKVVVCKHRRIDSVSFVNHFPKASGIRRNFEYGYYCDDCALIEQI